MGTDDETQTVYLPMARAKIPKAYAALRQATLHFGLNVLPQPTGLRLQGVSQELLAGILQRLDLGPDERSLQKPYTTRAGRIEGEGGYQWRQ
eukprot:12932745-Prorocentrum_lima.AAC.1